MAKLLKRVVAVIAAACLAVSMLTVGAFGVTDTKPVSGWDEDCTILDVHAGTTDSLTDFCESFGDHINEATPLSAKLEYKIGKKSYYTQELDWEALKDRGSFAVSPEGLKHGGSYSASVSVGDSYTIPSWMPLVGGTVLSAETTVPLGAFKLNVFDVVTINTFVDGVKASTVYEKVYRGESVDIEVADRSAEYYSVAVGGAVSADAPGVYALSGLSGDVEVNIEYTSERFETVLDLKDASVDLKTLRDISFDEAEILSLVVESLMTFEGATSDDFSRLYVKSINGVEGAKEITELGEHVVVVAFDADEINTAAVVEAKLTLNDARPATVVVAKQPASGDNVIRIGYRGKAISQQEIVEAVVASVESEGVAIEGGVAGVEITKNLEKWGTLVGIIEGYYPYGSKDIADSTLSGILGETGKYKTTVRFAGTDDFASSAVVEIEFEVYDSRMPVVVNVADATVSEKDLNAISYTLDDVIDAVLVSVTENTADGKVIEGARPEVVSIQGEESGKMYDAGILGGIASTDKMPITAVDTYTVELKFPASETHKESDEVTAIFVVADGRAVSEIVLVEDVIIECDDINDPVSTQDAFDVIFEAVMADDVELGLAYNDLTVVMTKFDAEANKDVVVDGVTAAGTYKLTVSYAGDNLRLPSSASARFFVSDGRFVPVATIDTNEIAYDFSDGLSADELFGVLNVAVFVDGEALAPENFTYAVMKDGVEFAGSDFAIGDYALTVTTAEGSTWVGTVENIPFKVVDARSETILAMNAGASIAYKQGGYTAEEIFGLMFASLADAEGNNVAAELVAEAALALAPEAGYLAVDVPAIEGVGTYEATIAYSGDWSHKPATVTAEFEVVKGETNVNIESQTVTYAAEGYSSHDFISVDPEASLVTLAVGLTLGKDASADAGVDAYVNIPVMGEIDKVLNELPESVRDIVKGLLDDALAGLADGNGMSISSFREALEGLSGTLEDANSTIETWNDSILGSLMPIDVELDAEAINTIVSVLEQIEAIEGVGELTIYVTLDDSGITLKDSGVYVTGAVTIDANYETAFGLGYMVIKPAMTKVDLAFNIEDENGFVTYALAQSGEYDLGTHVIPGNLTDDQLAAANAQVQNLFVGVDLNGEPVIVDNQSELTIGAFAQLGYILDLGNEMFYAAPIARAFAVVTDLAIVEFENGEQQQFVYSGEPQAMTAVAVNRAGETLPSENISYRYLGVEGDLEFYDSPEAPEHAGIYTVIATYLDAELKHAGMALGMMTIAPAEVTVEVSDLCYIYDGEKVDVASMAVVEPAAEIALITAGINVSGDFSENGLDAVRGIVNVDFPVYIDEVLKTALPSLYADGVTASDFAAKLASAKGELAEIGIDGSYVDELVAMIEDMPNATTLTFKEQADVAPVAPGAYVVIAVVMDPDYKVAADMGVLVIAPEITQAKLEWDYVDSNGIFTSPLLEQNPAILNATPYDAEGVAVDAQVNYLYIGIDENGAYVTTADANELGLGVYTQIAFIGEGISANIKIAEPILRTIVIAPQLADVKFVDAQGENDERIFVYTGEPKSMPVKAYNGDGVELTAGTVSYLYAGIEGDAEDYLSSEAPTEVGTYVVTATYVEHDGEGTLAYVGSAVGVMVIAPAEGKYELADTVVVHNGEGQWVDVVNEYGMPYEVSVVVDGEGNVNVVAPEGWNVENRVISDVEGLVEALIADFEDMASVAQNPVYKAALEKFVAALRAADIKSIEIDGEKPSEPGVYKIHTLAFGNPNYGPAYANAVLTIEHQWAVELSSDAEGHWHACEVEGCEERNEFVGHDSVVDDAVDAGCESDGLTEGSHCETCEYVIVEQEVVEALGHDMGEWFEVTPAACMEDGLEQRDCSRCDHSDTNVLPALGHTEETELVGAVEAGCESAGYTGDGLCKRCGGTVAEGEEIPALGHTEETDLVGYKAATETEDGYTGDETCKRCGAVVKQGEIIPATGVTPDPEPEPDPEPVWFEVVLADGEGFSIAVEGLTNGKVMEGEGFKFQIAAETGYDVVEVLVNGEPVAVGSDGYVAVENVDGPVVVQVKTAVKYYDVALEGENCTIVPAGLVGGKVAHGGSFSFVVSPAEGYEVVKVLVDGEVVEAEDGVFQVGPITGPVSVEVETAEIETPVVPEPEPVWFDVLVFAENCKVNVEGLTDGKVKEGAALTFTVTANEGYEAPVVTVNGQPVVAVDGKYTVENVSATVVIEAKASVKYYEVALEGENCTIVPVGLVEGKVAHGGSFSFVVNPAEGYEVVKVLVDGEVVEAEDGVFQVGPVTGPVSVEVETAEIETPVVPEPEPDPEPISIEDAVIAGIEDRVYTSKALTAELVVTMGDEALVEGIDYTVAYAANIEVGTATVTVTGIGDYTGTKSATFEVAHYAVAGLFKDFQSGSWYLDETQGAFSGLRTLYMDYALAAGLMSGYKNADGSMTTFGPWDSLDRAQAATIIYRMAVEDASATVDPAKYANNATDLSDVENGKYYTAAVNWCVENGVITGYLGGPDDGKYKPYKKVTRQELALMIQRLCVNVFGAEDLRADVSGYSDSAKIADWAVAGLEFCKAQGIMSGVYGTDKLNPIGNANRAEAAKMFAVVGHDILEF